MKKLLSGMTCVLYLHCFAQPIEAGEALQKSSGEKTLIKAIATIVNREGNKKIPPRKQNLSSSDSPLG